MFIGFGTVANVATVIVGGGLGLVVGHRLPERSRDLVTDVLGLMTIVLGGSAAASIGSAPLGIAVGSGALVVLGALLLGGLVGAGVRLEERIEAAADNLRGRLHVAGNGGRFTEGLVTASLVFCVGPLAIVGSLSDGLGRGSEQLLVKAVLDGFAAMVFATTLGAGVLASAAVVGVYQGLWTLVGWLVGDFLPAAQVDAITATGGVILIGLGLRLMGIKRVRVGDLLPALAFAPLLVCLIGWLR